MGHNRLSSIFYPFSNVCLEIQKTNFTITLTSKEHQTTHKSKIIVNSSVPRQFTQTESSNFNTFFNSTDLRASQEADSTSGEQEIALLSWNAKVHQCYANPTTGPYHETENL